MYKQDFIEAVSVRALEIYRMAVEANVSISIDVVVDGDRKYMELRYEEGNEE